MTSGAEHMTSCARVIVAIGISLGLTLGAPFAQGAEPNSNSATQNTRHKKPKANPGAQNTKSNNPATNSGAQNSGNCAPRYATTGVCKGCKIKLPCPTRQAAKPRQAQTPRPPKTPRQAQAKPNKLPKDWPNRDNCRYAMPSDNNWQAEQAACQQVGLPTWADYKNISAPAPETTPKPDDTIGGYMRSGLQPLADSLRQKVDDGINQAHGAQPTCPSNTSVEQDAGTGCHE
jgi:hypothetical protein